MDAKRVLEILLTELSLDNLKLQEKLQEQMNTQQGIDIKLLCVKEILERLVINELMINKFKSLTAPE